MSSEFGMSGGDGEGRRMGVGSEIGFGMSGGDGERKTKNEKARQVSRNKFPEID